MIVGSGQGRPHRAPCAHFRRSWSQHRTLVGPRRRCGSPQRACSPRPTSSSAGFAPAAVVPVPWARDDAPTSRDAQGP